ncbi:MAG TPA: hypothetical protein VFT91_09465 [Dehalococcoidia bacterium]|nr:hypothetical protein [Dehalococcoidia bacterium]
MLNAEQGFLAVSTFLNDLWEGPSRSDELGLFCGMIHYVPGEGSSDPAMWYDWLARVHQRQTGVLVPEGTGRRGKLSAELMKLLDPEQAYLAMYDFIEEYWLRVNRPAELGDLLGQLRYTARAGSADPAMWPRWLDAVRKVQSDTSAAP